MISWLPAIPYPPEQHGYWSPVTSTLDWCEENYYATPWSAEIVNSLTNVFFLYLGLKGVHSCLTQGHDRIFLISFCGYLLVGTGSFLFHTSLKYPMQLLDELSMIYTTCIMFYATFSFRKSTRYVTILGTGLVALATFITLYYHYIQDPTFHQNAYALLTAVVLFRAMYVMEWNIRPSLKQKQRDIDNEGKPKEILSPKQKKETLRQDERDIKILNTMWVMIAYGLGTFLGGFAIWGLDNVYCSKLRVWRREVGLPWGIVLEGHGWWHIMTGIGAYFYLTWGIWLRHCLNNKQDEYELIWPRTVTSMPSIVRRRPTAEGNGVARKNI